LSESYLKIQNLNVSLGKNSQKSILKQVTFNVPEGSLFGLLGPNGSGKSTMLAALSGLVPIPSNCVEWTGPNSHEFWQGISVVFQTPSLDKRLTVRRNLLLTCRLFEMNEQLACPTVETKLREAGLLEHADKKVMELSGGLKRRADLVRALLGNPRLLLLDEPTGGLDEYSSQMFWNHLLAWKAKDPKVTVLLATHASRQAEHCSEVAIFLDGKVVEVATPAALKKRMSKDVVTLRFSSETTARIGQSKIQEQLSVSARLFGNTLHIDSEEGSKLIPRIAEALDRATVEEISLKSASMADVFLNITGKELNH
jgi:ABC-2 type transport system ATP-binding protein